jgi:hypothetical protein
MPVPRGRYAALRPPATAAALLGPAWPEMSEPGGAPGERGGSGVWSAGSGG